ncbi:hypothetical protein [Kitasatospora sp. NPDC088351]
MPESVNPEPAEVEAEEEDVDVVAHGAHDDDACCIVNLTASL